MAKKKGEATESLSIYLAKEGLTEVSSFLKSTAGLRTFPINDDAGLLGTLYIQPRKTNVPRWAKLFDGQVDPAAFGRTSSTAGLFLVPIDDRILLLTFGQGRHLVKPESIEERFGRLVTLNSVGEDRVRSLDKQTFDTLGRHTRVQSSKEVRPQELGIDVDQELLRTCTGAPLDESLGKMLSGIESLHALVKVELSSLRKLLIDYLDQYTKEAYKSKFPWIDLISYVEDEATIGSLNSVLLDAIDKEQFNDCWLAVPEPIDWAQVAGFKYGRGWSKPLHHDISFETFLSGFSEQESIDIALLQRRDVICIGADDMAIHTWPVYKCINYEVGVKGNTYILNGGKWWSITNSLVKQVNEEIKRIPLFKRELPEFGDEAEGDYNARVAKSDPKTFALMDVKLIPWGGGNSKFEFCDLYTDTQELIHVKRYAGSGVLSHLFFQGINSAELFVTEEGFRAEVNGLLPKSHKFNPKPRPNMDTHTVVFAIVSQQTGKDLTLPFFSRLGLRQAVRKLRGFGFKVALAKIRVVDDVVKTKKYKAKKIA